MFSHPPLLTVMVCTYNPVPEYLHRCLDALKTQTLPKDDWELLVIDNCSSERVEGRYDLSWHPRSRHLQASVPGKTHAIAVGVREAAAPVLLIVDDDNVLARNYLELVEIIMREHLFLGVIGGTNKGEFMRPPPPWTAHYSQLLALGALGDRPLYCCSPDKTYVPPGAGMAIRKVIVETYLRQIADDPIRQGFDPVGTKLSRSGDIDMALCAWDLGLAKGFFPELVLTHIIPPKRLEVAYLADLLENSLYCDTLLQLIRGLMRPCGEPTFFQRLQSYLRWLISVRHMTPEQKKIESAGRRGILEARKAYTSLKLLQGRAHR